MGDRESYLTHLQGTRRELRDEVYGTAGFDASTTVARASSAASAALSDARAVVASKTLRRCAVAAARGQVELERLEAEVEATLREVEAAKLRNAAAAEDIGRRSVALVAGGNDAAALALDNDGGEGRVRLATFAQSAASLIVRGWQASERRDELGAR
jgi:hypothetical protein